MRKSVGCFCLICGAVGFVATNGWAQVPVFKVEITEVYQQVGPDQWIAKCGSEVCPTQNLPEGVAEPGDFLHITVTVEGWDAEPDRGICDNPEYDCSVLAQDCTQKHCRLSGGWCRFDSDCQGSDTCVPDVCHRWPRVGGYQWVVDSSGYWNGGMNPGLAPGVIDCIDDEHCWCYYDSTCFSGAEFGRCTCSLAVCEADETCSFDASVYVDESNLDFLFLTIADFAAVDFSTLDYMVGAVVLTPPGAAEYPATGAEPPYYVGTLLLQATDNACGTFVVDMLQRVDPILGPRDTWLNDDNALRLPTPIVDPVTVNFPALSCAEVCDRPADQCMVDWCNPCTGECEFSYDNGAACEDGDLCTENDYCENGVCKPGPRKQCDPGFVCDPVDGECKPECTWEGVSGTFPPDCAIDARQPHALNDANVKYGWNQLVLEFECNPDVLNAQPADFGARTVPFGEAPFIDSVVTNVAERTVTVTLDRIIETSYWTCINHSASGNEWCMGYLPGDADQNAQSGATDINALIGSINGGMPLPDYATDMNRSNATNAQDILRLIDLLNGAGQFQRWNNLRLDPCP